MDQQFSLTWNNFHGNLTKGFAGLLGNSEFVDVTIAVDGHVLQAHKVILSICSPYFKKMFQVNPCQHPIVVLRDVSHKAMKDLMQFMYHGEVSVKREDLTTFISTAELLQIKGLTNKETDEEENVKDADESHNTSSTQHKNQEPQVTDSFEAKNEIAQTNELLKQREFIEKLQRLSNLKRKSEEFLQNSYYSDLIAEKRSKTKDKFLYNKPNNHMPQNSNYESKFYDDNLTDSIPYLHVPKPTNLVKESKEIVREEKQSSTLELKTECEDLDIVSDPTECTSPKDYEGSKDNKNESPLPLDYQSPQDIELVGTRCQYNFDVPVVQLSRGLHKVELLGTTRALSLVINDSNESHKLPTPYKYIYSRKGHKQLVYMNFVYTKHSTTHGKTSWRCVQYFSLNRCPATVETVDSMLYAVNHQHNHEDCYEKLTRNNIYEMNSSPK